MITVQLETSANYQIVQMFGEEAVVFDNGFDTVTLDQFISDVTSLYQSISYISTSNRENLTGLIIKSPTVQTTLNDSLVNVSPDSNMRITSGQQAYIELLANLS